MSLLLRRFCGLALVTVAIVALVTGQYFAALGAGAAAVLTLRHFAKVIG